MNSDSEQPALDLSGAPEELQVLLRVFIHTFRHALHVSNNVNIYLVSGITRCDHTDETSVLKSLL